MNGIMSGIFDNLSQSRLVSLNYTQGIASREINSTGLKCSIGDIAVEGELWGVFAWLVLFVIA